MSTSSDESSSDESDSHTASSEASSDQHVIKNLIRSQYKDIMVKVDDDVYYLDRLKLALKSEYFEKLFIEDFSDRNSDLIELPMIDTDTFSAVVDIIYGKPLWLVIRAHNFVSLLMAMDYLQMDIDSKNYKDFVTKQFGRKKPFNEDVLKLYYFIAENTNYEYLSEVVFQYLSDHIETLQDREEFLSIPFDHYVQIISKKTFTVNAVESTFRPFGTFSRICAKWIYHDSQNRLPHLVDLVNAARSRFYISNEIPRNEFSLKLFTTDDGVNLDLISTKFYQLMAFCGEICYSYDETLELRQDPNTPKKDEYYVIDDSSNDDTTTSEEESSDDSSLHEDETLKKTSISPSPESKLKTFLKNGTLYDITVKVGEKTYKLHRSILKSESVYFDEIFTKECCELADEKCKGIPPTPPSKEKEYFIDGIDSEIFDIVVNHMYSVKVQFTSDVIVRLFKAAHILKIGFLRQSCSSWMQTNSEDICAADVIEILNFTHENEHFRILNRFFLSKYIVNSWPKIDNLPQFADLFKAIGFPEESNSTDENNTAHLFDKIDQEIFRLIIDYIYFKKAKFNSDNIVRALKASEMFKMEALMDECVDWLIQNCKSISTSDVVEVLSIAGRTMRNEILHTMYLVEHLMRWPNVELSLLHSISHDCLQNMLMCPSLCFDDPYHILDICSEWVTHDIENRYDLIPQIALAISQNCSTEYAHPTSGPSNLKQCSRDFVKDKIQKILSSTSVLPPVASSRNLRKKRKTEHPVFIMRKKGEIFHLLNSQWNEFASFRLCKNVGDYSPNYLENAEFPVSATIIDNNLFILCTMRESCFFHVYSLLSKNLFTLASDPRIYQTTNSKKYENATLSYSLLNCRNEIYCCIENGEIFKYVFELNRWMRFSRPEPNRNGIHYTSDGKELYRMCMTQRTDTMTYYTSQVYNFGQNLWFDTDNFPRLTRHHNNRSYETSDEYRALRELVFIRNFGFAALFREKLFLLKHGRQAWRNDHNFPHKPHAYFHHSIVGQDETDSMMYVLNNKLYRYYRPNREWQLQKEWPLRKFKRRSYCTFLPYENMVFIHKPICI